MNILFVTCLFPSFDVEYDAAQTKFVYYYASEWLKQGHNVLVLHSSPRYPRFFSPAVEFVENYLGFSKYHLSRYRQNWDSVKSSIYEYEGIKIIRTPIRKLIPHRDYLFCDLFVHKKKILRRLQESEFIPDVVFSDFITPSIDISVLISQKYNTKFYQIFHDTDFAYLRKHPRFCNMVNKASGVLLRSFSQEKHINEFKFDNSKINYILTGVPDNIKFGMPRNRIRKLLYVGLLIKRKNVDVLLKAIANAGRKELFTLDIIGDGPCRNDLENLAKELGLQDHVVFHGRLDREKVFESMNDADCFIMSSRGETFGMVYIEALSQGCVVVASKNEGVDGIIIDGENGFLVEAGNVNELSELLDNLAELDSQKVIEISGSGLQTASKMTDGYLAKKILEELGL